MDREYTNINIMKNFLLSFWGKESALDKALSKQTSIDPKRYPYDIIQELRRGQFKKFVAAINSSEPEPLLALRKLALVHNLIVHEPKLCQPFESINTYIVTNDEWMNEHVLHPYSVFLYKIINSGGLYSQCKIRGVLQISYKMLFYVINTLNELFPCVRKISSLHRYYSAREKQLSTSATTDFVMVLAYEAHELYNFFKASLGEMIGRPEMYIKSEDDKKMIKYVLEDVLMNINQEMKNLFLDKYYFPYGKGFGVKLFKEEDLTGHRREYVDQLSMLDMQAKPKKSKKKMTLDKLLFDHSGRLNPEVYVTLSQIRQGDESLMERGAHSEVKYRTDRTQVSQQLTENI